MQALMRTLLVFAAILLSVPQTASAQSYRLAPVSVEQGEWYFQPVLRFDLGRVDSIVALAKIGGVSGNNIVAVWYQRGADDEAAWTAKSWGTPSVDEAIKSVKEALQLPDADDGLWPVGDATVMNAIPSPEDPEDYFNGLLADDALAALVAASPDRDFLVSFLVDVGYKAADIDIEKVAIAVGCGTKERLTGIAKGAEVSLVTSDSSEMEAAAYAYNVVTCEYGFCIPWTWTSTGPSAWSPALANCWSNWSFLGLSGPYGVETVFHCDYDRTCTQTQTRTQSHRYWDCRQVVCFQTNTRVCTETDYCLLAGGVGDCATNAEQHPQCAGELGDGTINCVESGWTPQCVW